MFRSCCCAFLTASLASPDWAKAPASDTDKLMPQSLLHNMEGATMAVDTPM